MKKRLMIMGITVLAMLILSVSMFILSPYSILHLDWGKFYIGGRWGGIGRYEFTMGLVVPTEDVVQLTSLSDYVIRGEVLDSRVEWQGNDRGRVLRTVYRIEVLEVFQGTHVVGDVIEVSRLGGQKWYVEWVSEYPESEIELLAESEYILFLYSWDWSNREELVVSVFEGAYHVLTPMGDIKMLVLEDSDSSFELVPVSNWNHIVLTLEDLIEIAEGNGLIDPDETDD